MLFPVIFLYAIASIALLIIGINKKNPTILAVLNLLLWLASIASAIAIWSAWKYHFINENWVFLAVLFFSFPTILLTFILIIALLIAIKKKKMVKMGLQQTSLYLLLVFLAVQIIFGVLSGL